MDPPSIPLECGMPTCATSHQPAHPLPSVCRSSQGLRAPKSCTALGERCTACRCDSQPSCRNYWGLPGVRGALDGRGKPALTPPSGTIVLQRLQTDQAACPSARLPQTNDFGVAKDGRRKDSFQLGMALTGGAAGRLGGPLAAGQQTCCSLKGLHA